MNLEGCSHIAGYIRRFVVTLHTKCWPRGTYSIKYPYDTIQDIIGHLTSQTKSRERCRGCRARAPRSLVTLEVTGTKEASYAMSLGDEGTLAICLL